MNQIAMVNQSGKASAERVIVLPEREFDALVGRPGYHQRDNGDLERREGILVYLIVRQQGTRRYRWEKKLMDNEDNECVEVLKCSGLEGKQIEAKGVSRANSRR